MCNKPRGVYRTMLQEMFIELSPLHPFTAWSLASDPKNTVTQADYVAGLWWGC